MVKRNNSLFLVVLLLIVGLGVGYSALTTGLSINGSTSIKGNSWDLHFENVQITEGSAKAVLIPETDNLTTTEIAFGVNLNKPGDYYEFTVDAVNKGTIDVMVDSVADSGLTDEQEVYLNYSVTYLDGSKVLENQLLAAGDKVTYKVRIDFVDGLDMSLYSEDDQDITLSFGVNYLQADESAYPVTLGREMLYSFSTDSWETIIDNVQNNNKTYKVGDTKQVDLGTYGVHTVRVANNSTPDVCATEGFSQTACGFVVEFADIITTRSMNSTETNIGGWPATEMRTFLNDTNDANSIINALNNVFDTSKIMDTFVVSGHGSSDTNNFTSTDKLYLLSSNEVRIKKVINSTDGTARDTGYDFTRQLDYYANYVNSDGTIGVIDLTVEATPKKYGTEIEKWWLRSTSSTSSGSFSAFSTSGLWDVYSSSNGFGVSPAFRLG